MKKVLCILSLSIIFNVPAFSAEYNPYSKPLKNELVESLIYTQSNISIVRNQYIPKTYIKKRFDSWEYLITNNSEKDIILQKIVPENFLSLTQAAGRALKPNWKSFVPVYNIVVGAQVDIEKNRFTRPLPLNVTIKPQEQLRILALTDKNIKPSATIYFLIDGNENIIKLNGDMTNEEI